MLRLFRRLLDILSRRARVQFILLMLVHMAVSLLEVAGIAAVMPFMALVVNPQSLQSSRTLSALRDWLQMSDATFLTWMGLSVVALLVAANTGRLLANWVTLRYQHRQTYHLSRRLLEGYMGRPYAFFLGQNSGALLGNALSKVPNVTEWVLRQVIELAASGLLSVTILALLLVVNPAVAVSIAAVLGLTYLTIYLLMHRRLAYLGRQQNEVVTRMHVAAAESLGAVKELKLLGRERSFLGRFVRAAEQFARFKTFLAAAPQWPRQILETVAFGGIVLTVVFSLQQGRQANHIVPILALYAFAGYRLLPALHRAFQAVTALRAGSSSLNQLHADLVGAPELRRSPATGAHRPERARFATGFALRDVDFTYEGAAVPALQGVNLSIQPNTTVALVGPTGCGKSTLVDIILGLLTPTRGELVLDGSVLTAAKLPGWQGNIGYVPQDIFLSDSSIASNIALGVPAEEIDMDAVRKAATIAHLAEFIDESLPQGYDTPIGEAGVRLSGGQRQRLGIARAMYHDPAVLVMDEATSALDGVTEEGVMRSISELSGRKTILLVAHRLSTVRNCDVIVQLDRGAIVAAGTYDELMRDSEWFRRSAQGPAPEVTSSPPTA